MIALGAGFAQAAGPGFDWNGPYVGGNIGLAILDGNIGGFDFLTSVDTGMNDTGVTFGGQLGWNFRNGDFVFGVEGDINYLDLDDRISFAGGKATVGVRADYDWFATIRGRAGMLVDESVLIYATGGVAFIDSDLKVTNGAFSATDSDILTGWTAGGGVEWAFSDSISAKIEYLYADFGKRSLTVAGAIAPVTGFAEPEIHIVRLGVNWDFCAGIGC